jgi:hypothetical protein
MSRVGSAALSLLLLGGCLDPLAGEAPGYSRHLLSADAEVASVSSDPAFTRRVDMNDGISMGTAPLKSGFAVGKAVKYWDLGLGRGTGTPAYKLARCDDEQVPLEDGAVDHPLFFDAVPGDSDYTQFWAVSFVCVTAKYKGERITNMLALADAYELGLALEPKEPLQWLHAPVVLEGVVLDGAGDGMGLKTAYCRGLSFTVADLGEQAVVDPSIVSMGKSITSGNVYEIVRQGSTKVERVIFGSAGFNEDGSRSEKYVGVWTLVNVTITADASIDMFTQESEIATVNMDRSFTKANDKITTIVASTTRTSREVQF